MRDRHWNIWYRRPSTIIVDLTPFSLLPQPPNRNNARRSHHQGDIIQEEKKKSEISKGKVIMRTMVKLLWTKTLYLQFTKFNAIQWDNIFESGKK